MPDSHSAPPAPSKASDLLVAALETEGVEYVFAVPGEENLDLLESLRTSKIELVLTRHEQGAAFMAATYGRLTGKAGVCMATLGPGATNFATPAAYAHLGAMPLIMISGLATVMPAETALAALMCGAYRPAPGERVAVLICGGNIAPDPLG